MESIELKSRVLAEARRLGFDAAGVARADVPLDEDYARYEDFIARDMHGEMGWLAENDATRGARRRVDGEHILPGARSVIVVARRYGRSAASESRDPELARSIARYARGRDYHNGMRKKLRRLAAFVRAAGEGIEARPLCDEEPILERAWAARAGLGFVGKNGLLIVPGVGSLVLLGEVVTTLALPADAPIPERCGSCTRCLDACPTKAFAKPFVLEPTKCVAYLTIESRTAIPVTLRDGVGDHLFGCDDCQTVCPFNARTLTRELDLDRETEIDARFAADPRWSETSLGSILALDDEGFVRLREGSPIGRATRVGLARNAAVVLGNRRDPGALPALERARADHDSAIVRETAGWAIAKITDTQS